MPVHPDKLKYNQRRDEVLQLLGDGEIWTVQEAAKLVRNTLGGDSKSVENAVRRILKRLVVEKMLAAVPHSYEVADPYGRPHMKNTIAYRKRR